MKLWLDCEFNSYRGDLLSIALVDEKGFSFYKVLPYSHLAIDPWVQANVIPFLNAEPTDRLQVQLELQDFLEEYQEIFVIADWPDDIKYFMELLITAPGERIDTPPLKMTVRRDIDVHGIIPHNALSDAEAMRQYCLLND